MFNSDDKRTTIKICGLTTASVVEAVSGYSVEQVGFVFAMSRRKITPEQAGIFIMQLRSSGSKALSVGVFVNPSMEELRDTLHLAPLDVIQLHGNESPDFCSFVKREFPDKLIYKVFAVDSVATSESVAQLLEPYRDVVDAIMLDAAGGGTGTTFQWESIPTYQTWTRFAHLPLIIAGGLYPDNVQELIKRYQPDGVDVSSGVETDGQKDLQKIKAFIERVKQS
jgi:phosphoribosylanthranilate isomerase